MFPFRTEPLTPSGEAIQIHGLERAHLTDAAVREELNRLWIRHGLVVFRGMEDSDELHLELSRVFGPFQLHPIKQGNTDPSRLEITNVQYEPGGENGNVYSVNGVDLGGWLPLHFDLVYFDKVNHGGLLRPRVIPPEMGGTVFLDKIAAYDTLPEELKRRAEGLEVVYDFYMDISTMKNSVDDIRLVRMGKKFRDIQQREDSYPRSIHPLVYAQKETGRKMLNLSPWFADELLGLDKAEGDALLGELVRHTLSHPQIHVHRWTPGDIVLWDNWRMLHGAEGLPPESGSRWLQRTTLAGDYALGRLEGVENSTLELVDV
ncbi:TauD/TfdA family dioxygenase [Sphingomonas histidinilytica]|uniref:Taurine dioxygenase n=1 Tax=Rhizorhabdus histidinilytica TaxID=439228 RepID=A0A1T5GBD1_9SPHN|nr:TauD/TfdA family dioxygenase [Rhizorhabdus histidinilytica]MBO9379839.1 TauD/TfdA family dioxygenase [Rhizorhabdus histidinilytica]SKC05744.1 taurine dioxygenase [Rhizorhabdus histidinilytica]